MNRELPIGWRVSKLSQLSSLITKGTTPTTNGFDYTDSGVNFLRVENISSGGKIIDSDLKYISSEAHSSLRRSQLKEGDLLISIAGAIGRSAIVEQKHLPANTNQAVGIVRLLDGGADNRFVRFSFESPIVEEQINNLQAGLAQVNLNLEQLGSLNISLPPIQEQQKIASILTAVDEVIESTQAQINKLKDLKTGMIQELLTKGIGHTEFKDSPLGQIPKSWEVLRCNEVAEKITDGEHLSPKYVEVGQPILSAKDVLAYGVDFSNAKQVSDIDFKKMLARCNPEYGDVLIVSRGATIGKTTLNVSEKSFALMGSVILLKPNKKKTVGSYLSLLIAQPEIQNEMLSLSGSSAQQAIYLKDIKDMRLRIPPILEQEAISKAIDSLDQRIITTSKKFSAFEKLKKSLMQDLLTGSVRVNVVP